MMSWRNLFKPWILTRGREYFECGQVVELKEVGSVMTEEGSGSKVYRVEIQRSGERVTSMSCDCPHATGGEYCKYMAAVLYALDGKMAQPPDGLADGTGANGREPAPGTASQPCCGRWNFAGSNRLDGFRAGR